MAYTEAESKGFYKAIGASEYKLALQVTLLRWELHDKNPAQAFNQFMKDVDGQFEKEPSKENLQQASA